MSTRLSDVIVPEVFSPYIKEMANTTSRLIASGAVVMDGKLNAFLAGGGDSINVPGWKSKDGVIFNADNDDPTDIVTADKVTAGVQIAKRMNQNYHVGAGRFTAALAGSSPLASVASEASMIYQANRQAHLLASLNGLFADVGGVLNSEVITHTAWSSDLLVDAEGLFGDFTTGTGLLVVGSKIFADMRKENLISYRPLSDQIINFPDYLGYGVLVDATLGDSAYVMRGGAVKMGTGTVFADTYEAQQAGHGAGIEYLRMLDEYCLHVDGTSFIGSAVNPTAADLMDATNWDAVYDLKHIGVKKIKVNRPG